jgi:hypothetical protein
MLTRLNLTKRRDRHDHLDPQWVNLGDFRRIKVTEAAEKDGANWF